jgi:hypothetical protein
VQETKEVLVVELMQQVATITSEVYYKTLTNLSRGIQHKRHGMLTSSAVLFDYNVSLHTSAHTQAMLEHFNWELFTRPP